MELTQMTWPEVGQALSGGICALLPVGSIEQHGPMGLIGTDAICANAVALRAAEHAGAIAAPAISYTPAPFNTAFPGTISITPDLLEALLEQICRGLLAQGFLGVYIVNGHGANIAPIKAVADRLPRAALAWQSWWEPAPVNALRQSLYGAWEGMHATPSEVAITQALHGPRDPGAAVQPPERLSPAFIRAHAGDRHGPPDAHRAAFPDGRVGSHSALARPEHGAQLLDLAGRAIAESFSAFQRERRLDQPSGSSG